MAWVFYLCQSSDMTRLGEFTEATNRSLVVALNRGGSFTANVGMTDDIASLITPLTTCVEAVKNGVTRWSGPVTSVLHEAPARKIQMQCGGWFDLLRKRVIRDRGIISYGIVNPGLEFGASGWTWNGAGSHSLVTTTPHSGTQSDQLITVFSGVGISEVAYQAVTGVPIGSAVTLSVWIRKWATSGALAATDVQIGFGDSPFTTTYAGNAAIAATLSTAAWAQYTASWITTVSSFSVFVALVNLTGGTTDIQWDDMTLTYETLSFQNADIGEIAQSLVDRVNSWDTCPVTRGTTQTSWNRTVRFLPFQNVGEEIQRMSDIENGFDFEVDPTTRRLNVYYPMKGVVRTSYDSPADAYTKIGPRRVWRFADAVTGSTDGYLQAVDSLTHGTALTVSQTSLCSYDPTDFSKSRTMPAAATFADIDTAAYTDLSPPNSFSMSFLFKLSALASIDYLELTQGWGGAFRVMANGSIELDGPTSAHKLTSAASLVADNTTTHIVVSYDYPTKILSLFVNGVVAGTLTAVTFAAASYPLRFFSRSGVGAVSPTLTVDEIATWQGRSLSYAETQFLYQSYRLRSSTQAIEAVRFGYGTRGAGNLKSVTKRVETQGMSNWVVAQGKGSSGGGGALALDELSISTYGALDEVTTLSQIDSLTILAAYANAEVAVRGRPMVTYEITPLTASGIAGGPNVPSPFEDYDIGDIIRFDALDGTIDVTEQNMRIFSIKIDLDDKTDKETATLQTAPGS